LSVTKEKKTVFYNNFVQKATFDSCNTFNQKLSDTIKGLIGANSDRKAEIDSLRSDHEDLKKAHESFQVPMF
jgi:hypothetical protein